MERKLLPLAVRIEGNDYLSAIKDGFIRIMPFLIIGSFFLLIANLPFPGYNDFIISLLGANFISQLNYILDATYSVMALLVIISTSISLAKRWKLNEISCALISLVSFFIITPYKLPQQNGGAVTDVIPVFALGAQGLFLSLIATLLAVRLYRLFNHPRLTISMPESVPPAVANSFSSLIPSFLVVVLFWLVRLLFEVTSFGTVQEMIFTVLQAPMMKLGNTLPSQMIAEFFVSFFWFFGLHGDSIVTAIMGPVWRSLTLENLQAMKEGVPQVNIITQQFRDVFLICGGTGFTLAMLLVMLWRAKSKRMREIAKLAAPAAIFNINEPIIFGVPIALNPLLLIPFILVPVVLCVITYSAMAFGFLPLTSGLEIPWTTPIFISGFLICGWKGMLFQAINLIVAMTIYYPFVMTLDKQYLRDEISQNEQDFNEIPAAE
ncbi:PTS sugar transporter subunit IIC [Escherichia coli]|nr:PTS transporter subunit EIIC [Escherichia coli]EEZ6070079.1 PTS sugar transporter subunit IIC [Escherichia coli O121]EEV6142776.1 PTS sugar transporter subunit IIC [Escherichia coli]EJE0230805.1 PTS sugar transporter subunit IIC [Escherichia coli]KAA0478010.1 PTS sugar transporter subunit IIC [Escherichia coli]MIC58050.1 PTS sugar transporter subunit IIC [Escherichia coli]